MCQVLFKSNNLNKYDSMTQRINIIIKYILQNIHKIIHFDSQCFHCQIIFSWDELCIHKTNTKMKINLSIEQTKFESEIIYKEYGQ